MPFFALNGAEIELALGSGKRETMIIGERKRAFDGTLRQTVRAEKDAYDATSTLMARDDADALYRFLLGHGHNFRFAAALDYYSGKGLAGTPTATTTAGGATGKFDKRVTFDATGKIVWTPTGEDVLTGDYTLSVWRLTATGPDVWTHYLVLSSAGAVTYYEGGVLQGDSTTVTWEAKLSVTAGVLQLGDAANADAFSDLVALPFAVPTSWIPFFAATTIAFPNRPFLHASGDALNLTAAAPLECSATDVEFIPIPFVHPTSGEQLDGGRVGFRLEER